MTGPRVEMVLHPTPLAIFGSTGSPEPGFQRSQDIPFSGLYRSRFPEVPGKVRQAVIVILPSKPVILKLPNAVTL